MKLDGGSEEVLDRLKLCYLAADSVSAVLLLGTFVEVTIVAG